MERGAEDVGGLGLGTAAQAGLGLEPPGGGWHFQQLRLVDCPGTWPSVACGSWGISASLWVTFPMRLGDPPPPPLMLRCWEDRAGPPQTSGLPHSRAWAPCHLVPKRCSGKRGTRVPRAPAGSLGPWCHQPLVDVLGTPGHISCGRGRATVLHPQRPSREQGSCGQCGLMGGVSCLLCPPRQSPVASPHSPGLTHMPQGSSRPEWGRPGPGRGRMEPTATSPAAVG